MLAIDAIGQDPYRGEMLTGFDYRKWRVGDWRIIYAIEDEQLIVLIIDLGARGETYRRLNQRAAGGVMYHKKDPPGFGNSAGL
jgi:hypothetical protein